jgi:hypothetical protein
MLVGKLRLPVMEFTVALGETISGGARLSSGWVSFSRRLAWAMVKAGRALTK